MVCFGLSPLPVRVTTRIITFLVGDPYKPSFATVTGRGDNPKFAPTPPKFNMEPKNHPLEKEKHLPNLHVVEFHVSFSGGGGVDYPLNE